MLSKNPKYTAYLNYKFRLTTQTVGRQRRLFDLEVVFGEPDVPIRKGKNAVITDEMISSNVTIHGYERRFK